jgi:hypothetical protein
VDLAEQVLRDDVDVPPIVVKCCDAIETYGIHTVGVYRVGGTVTKINKLKEKLDRGMFIIFGVREVVGSNIPDLDAVDLHAEEWAEDISNVASVLKLWLRELPDPLLTHALHQDFLDAASKF